MPFSPAERAGDIGPGSVDTQHHDWLTPTFGVSGEVSDWGFDNGECQDDLEAVLKLPIISALPRYPDLPGSTYERKCKQCSHRPQEDRHYLCNWLHHIVFASFFAKFIQFIQVVVPPATLLEYIRNRYKDIKAAREGGGRVIKMSSIHNANNKKNF